MVIILIMEQMGDAPYATMLIKVKYVGGAGLIIPTQPRNYAQSKLWFIIYSEKQYFFAIKRVYYQNFTEKKSVLHTMTPKN